MKNIDSYFELNNPYKRIKKEKVFNKNLKEQFKFFLTNYGKFTISSYQIRDETIMKYLLTLTHDEISDVYFSVCGVPEMSMSIFKHVASKIEQNSSNFGSSVLFCIFRSELYNNYKKSDIPNNISQKVIFLIDRGLNLFQKDIEGNGFFHNMYGEYISIRENDYDIIYDYYKKKCKKELTCSLKNIDNVIIDIIFEYSFPKKPKFIAYSDMDLPGCSIS